MDDAASEQTPESDLPESGPPEAGPPEAGPPESGPNTPAPSPPDSNPSEPNPLLAIDAETFEALVVDELDALPDDMVDGLENIIFVTEDRPEDGSLDLLGLYDGIALTERASYGFGELPDRIILYREPLIDISRDLEELKDQIHITLVHEIAHFYGIDDDELHRLGWE